MANMLQYLLDIPKARYYKGGSLRFFVFRVTVEEQGVKTCQHGAHNVGLQIVANHQGGLSLGA